MFQRLQPMILNERKVEVYPIGGTNFMVDVGL